MKKTFITLLLVACFALIIKAQGNLQKIEGINFSFFSLRPLKLLGLLTGDRHPIRVAYP